MKIRVVIFNGINQFADMDLGLQLLADFPAERFLRTLTCLDLATGKFPAILKSSVATLRGKHLPVFEHHRCDNVYCLHFIGPKSIAWKPPPQGTSCQFHQNCSVPCCRCQGRPLSGLVSGKAQQSRCGSRLSRLCGRENARHQER